MAAAKPFTLVDSLDGAPLSEKLKAARRSAGLSTRAVAERISRSFPISHATIANYEKGLTLPTLAVIGALASLYERPLQWFLNHAPILTGIRYRNVASRIRISDLHRFEGEAQRWLSAYVAIEDRLGRPLTAEIRDYHANENEDPDDLSRRLRHDLGFKETDAIASVVDVLERFGVRVLEQATELRIDGLAARYGNQHVVVLNPRVSNDRGRLNGAHELAHVLYGDCDDVRPPSRAVEKRAFEFASRFLLPPSQLKAAFEGKSMVRLVQYKERFGISLAAMVYRAEQVGFLKKAEAKRLWVEFSRRGWRSVEPGHVRADRASRFEQLLDGAMLSRKLTLAECAQVAGVRTEELRRRVLAAMGMSAQALKEEVQPTVLKLQR